MRTDLTQDLAGTTVRGVVTIGALIEIAEHRDDFALLSRRIHEANAPDVRAVMRACLRAAGDLKPLDVNSEVDRLIEEAGLQVCSQFCDRLLVYAFNKTETARVN